MFVMQTKSDFVPSCLLFDAYQRCQFWWNWFVPLASAIWYPNLAQGMGENELALNMRPALTRRISVIVATTRVQKITPLEHYF